MALLRLTLVALAACGQAGAQPTATSGLTAPAGWVAIPEIATAVAAAAKADGSTIVGSEAWGDPARGCYGVWLALQGDGASAEQVLAGIAGQPITTTNIIMPDTADGIVTLSFEKGAHRGRLRARIAAGTITTIACFANDREPAACDAPCTGLLGGLP